MLMGYAYVEDVDEEGEGKREKEEMGRKECLQVQVRGREYG
jgi:hypothetical protein